MKTPRTHEFIIRLRVRAENADAREYISDAVRCYGGGSHPSSPFFGLTYRDLSVRQVPTKERTRK